MGVKGEQTVTALTFADYVTVPRKEKKRPGFDMGHFFNGPLTEWRSYIPKALVENVGMAPEAADMIKIYPKTVDPDERLPNEENWYNPLLLGVLNLLSPSAALQFRQKHKERRELVGVQMEQIKSVERSNKEFSASSVNPAILCQLKERSSFGHRNLPPYLVFL